MRNQNEQGIISRRSVLKLLGLATTGGGAAILVGCSSEKKPAVPTPVITPGQIEPTAKPQIPVLTETPQTPESQETPLQVEPAPELPDGWARYTHYDGSFTIDHPTQLADHGDVPGALVNFGQEYFFGLGGYIAIWGSPHPDPIEKYAESSKKQIIEDGGEAEILGNIRTISGLPTIAISGTLPGDFQERKLLAYVFSRNDGKLWKAALKTISFEEDREIFEKMLDSLRFTD